MSIYPTGWCSASSKLQIIQGARRPLSYVRGSAKPNNLNRAANGESGPERNHHLVIVTSGTEDCFIQSSANRLSG